ncbi:MAG: succinate dehydrogenase, cytochrome b556 subunit [Pseudomonadota bacterium]
MTAKPRPLSPHLSVYKFRITSTLSILHRMTGVVMSIGAVALVWWLFAVASGPEAYATFLWVAGSIIGKIAIAGWLFTFYYHLCNGIRHLFWDAGRGFELTQARRSGWTVVGVSSIATVTSWLVAFL